MTEEEKERRRHLIVYDGDKWHVRSIRRIVYDGDVDEKIYFCDKPISNDHKKLSDVPEVAALLHQRDKDVEELVEGLRSLAQFGHFECEKIAGSKEHCTCGADRNNKIIDALIAKHGRK